MKKLYFIICLTLLGVYSQLYSSTSTLTNWINEQAVTSERNLLRNISPAGTVKGTVVASPSQSNPDYFYHWVRDAALVMDVIVKRYQNESNPSSKTRYLEYLNNFIALSAKNQVTPNLSFGPGEPKFNPDGSAYNQPWGRPQDDGPALRAITFIKLARIWMNEGKTNWVKEKLYNSDSKSLVKFDLEYTAHNWKNPCFDLWEEVKGIHFYTRMAQRRAMNDGAELAEDLGDNSAGQFYRSQAKLIENELARHWDSSKKAIIPTLNNKDEFNGKKSGLDSAVILSVLHSHTEGSFSFSDDRILSTLHQLEDTFGKIYSINQKGFPALAVGRYPEDRYDGYSTEGQGNPWLLIISGYAEFYYGLARELKDTGEVSITQRNLAFYESLGLKGIEQGNKYRKGDNNYDYVLFKVKDKADQYLSRLKIHLDSTGGMSEQLNRESGYLQGARDLTWSYASFLTAVEARNYVF